jgi:hypothetical protein
MRDMVPLRERYLRDSLPVRLGGLAANLRRIRSFAVHESGGEAVVSLIEECRYFIEWTASETPIDTSAQLGANLVRSHWPSAPRGALAGLVRASPGTLRPATLAGSPGESARGDLNHPRVWREPDTLKEWESAQER